MNYKLILSIMLFCVISCKNNNTVSTPTVTTSVDKEEVGPIFFAEVPEHDFGLIGPNEAVEHDFVFENTGTEPLIIKNAESTCGCTIPKYPKEPIAPGQKSSIKVKFDPKGKKSGKVTKVITLSTNTKNINEKLKIKTEIK